MRAYRREHYHKDKEAYKARAIENVRICREYVHKIKEEGSCLDCGIEYPGEPWLFDFDHIDSTTKIKTVSELVRNGSLRLLKEEIDKCEMVCLICHRRRTALRAGWECAIL